MAVATVDTSRKIPDFPEYFEVNPAVAAGSPDLKAVQDCISELKQFIDYLGTLPVAKISVLLAAQAAVVEAKRPLRTQIMANLRKIADMFCAEEISPAEATHQVIMEQGRYDAGKERIEQFLFVVGEKFENDKAVDLLIRAHSGTATKVVTPEKEKLFVDLTNTLTVIRRPVIVFIVVTRSVPTRWLTSLFENSPVSAASDFKGTMPHWRPPPWKARRLSSTPGRRAL